jgi:acyl-CoA reductase-like NAD-dependent aldehyde dehydrogenase
LHRRAACGNIEAQVSLGAVTEGGKVLTGGKQPPGMGGTYYEPTIIDCPRQDLTIVDTELFGPVLSVLRFKTKRRPCGWPTTPARLAAGVFTR